MARNLIFIIKCIVKWYDTDDLVFFKTLIARKSVYEQCYIEGKCKKNTLR